MKIWKIKGPKRVFSIEKGKLNKMERHFSTLLCTRNLPIGKNWLVYSKELDKIFCFCCKLFKKGFGKGRLANAGSDDWSYLGIRTKEHELSMEHILNMTAWYELRLRFQKNETIDN